jgi:SSS family solute:Na+ symporter
MVNTILFWAATAVYAVVIFYLAWLGYNRTKCNADYMLAGRNIHPAILGLSYGATFISTSAIVGFGGYAAKLGLGIIWLVMLNILVGVLIAFIVFGKPTRRIGKKLGALTFPDLLGKVYRSSFMQYATGLIIMVGMPLYSSAVPHRGRPYSSRRLLDVPYLWAIIASRSITAA